MSAQREVAVRCEPPPAAWRELALEAPQGELLGASQREWRELTRRELGLPVDRTIIATGHQTLLWHPGILAKYIARDAAATACGFGQANLIVDQNVGDFGVFDVPIRKETGSLGVRRIELAEARPDVSMALHPAFVPRVPADDVQFASDFVKVGVQRIIAAVRAHAGAPNAAIQMSRALADLMQRWAGPTTDVTATALVDTSLARAMTDCMIGEPQRCAEAYNRAVAAVPEAGIPPLAVSRGEVELPLWRLGAGGERIRAYVHELNLDATGNPSRPMVAAFQVMPRALFMTALVRLGMCDLFIHGTGGAAYDRAMELWIRDWLDVEVAPVAVATADLYLPLMKGEAHGDVEERRHLARHLWHDPALDSNGAISAAKRAMIERINQLPRNSSERRSAYSDMHKRLEAMRRKHRDAIEVAFTQVEEAKAQAADWAIAGRRDWAFPLHPEAAIDELADAIRASFIKSRQE